MSLLLLTIKKNKKKNASLGPQNGKWLKRASFIVYGLNLTPAVLLMMMTMMMMISELFVFAFCLFTYAELLDGLKSTEERSWP